MKNERKSLPPELLPEIIDNLPINLRWSELRISLYFDAFLFKKQSKQIISIKKFLYQLYQLFKSANTCLKNWKPLLVSDDSTLSNLRNRLDQLCGALLCPCWMVAHESKQFSTTFENIINEWYDILGGNEIRVTISKPLK